MFEENLIIQTPNVYIDEPGIIKQVPLILNKYGYIQAAILTDNNVLSAVSDYVPDHFFEEYPTWLFQGNCTFHEIERLTDAITGSDALVALGGGQLLDTAKCVADNLHIALINVPTLPSNCACITTKSIVYSEQHEMIANVRHKQSVQMVLVDPRIQLEAPYEYILSGIGDTLAKWYEIRRRLTTEKNNSVISNLARHFIETCRDEMLKVTGIKNLTDQELRNLIDTIFLVAASVDGWAGLDGRSVAAHNFYNAYIKVYSQHTRTHGEIVAVGILVQLAIENEWQDLQKLTPYYKQIGLPLTVDELGLSDNIADLTQIALEMAKKDNIRMQSIFPDITTDVILKALKFVETLNVKN
ncbi:iron-containing alcohol dehydrogenase family protein [Loigolactobacillus binensis]|uniref:Iron-containing alcohol dehydrogenase family protein n=1 Tax=Loigolactobacillus binensis TaxID=2559922 RepID=A0ABW3ECI5_9LACO|nr:iron-containing alcohol dehydrogenase family protein [Loigolactobacillus binensis]